MVSATELSGSAVVGWVVRDVTCAQVFCREVDCCEFVRLRRGVEIGELLSLVVEWRCSWVHSLR